MILNRIFRSLTRGKAYPPPPPPARLVYHDGSGEDFSARDAYGRTALHYARVGGNPDLYPDLLSLLSLGLDIDAQDAKGWTKLHFAVQDRDLPTVDALLAHGADCERRESTGCTALHFAFMHAQNRPQIAWRLLAAGADPHAQDCAGNTPYSIAHASSDLIDFAQTFSAPTGNAPRPDPMRLGQERWGEPSTSAHRFRDYRRYQQQYMSARWCKQKALIMIFDGIRQENLGNGNMRRESGDAFEDDVRFFEKTLCADPLITKPLKDQIRADIDTILDYKQPEIDHIRFDRLQDRLVEFLDHHPDPIWPRPKPLPSHY